MRTVMLWVHGVSDDVTAAELAARVDEDLNDRERDMHVEVSELPPSERTGG